jgi:hypothetical protein
MALPDVHILKQLVPEPIVSVMQNNVNVMLNSNFIADISSKMYSAVKTVSKEVIFYSAVF